MDNISHIINAFRVIPKNDWGEVLTLLIPLMPEWMKTHDVSELIYMLQAIPKGERAARVSRALLFQSTVPSIALEYVLEQSLGQPIVVHEELLFDADLLDRHMNQENDDFGDEDQDGDEDEDDDEENIPQLMPQRRQDGGVHHHRLRHKRYVNVHSGTREKRTIEAIEGLLSHALTSEYKVSFDGFWDAVVAVEPLSKREKILRTLGVNLDLTPQKRDIRDFGGLLTSEDGTVTIRPGLRVFSRTLLTLFWNFAINEKDEKESENIRCAIMDGLAGSLQDDDDGGDHVVCDMGKLQRLSLCLQGRLVLPSGELVDIDGVQKQSKRLRTSPPPLPPFEVVEAEAAPAAVLQIWEEAEEGPAIPPRALVDAWHAAPAPPLYLYNQRHVLMPQATFVEEVKSMEAFLQPFVDDLCAKHRDARPKCVNTLLHSLIEYRNRCAKEVEGSAHISARSMMYYLFLMETHPFSFNPSRAMITTLSEVLFLDDEDEDEDHNAGKMVVNDYIDQLGAFGRMLNW